MAQRSAAQNGANLIQISHNSLSSHKVYVLFDLCIWRSLHHPAICLALPACLQAKQTAFVAKNACRIPAVAKDEALFAPPTLVATSRCGSINCSTKLKCHSNNVVVVRICARDLGHNTHNHAKEKQVDELALCPFKSLKKPRFTRQFFSFHSSRMDKDIDY
ncbi:hypothetical protein CY34DRAFT_798482 [Suillus luteus UH-Slu-Lm8-n1]|uniref:Uncharacterized protein n=1 Tax=Suillus luteus UH-Slu-Lm8-n1 TaxID=930992 RepID=A0A0D0B286_9AGAM|nr:hypothetical protein CY34DRAFT_798482 [Suillus luteus UH-Slu-Lm8-n1]